MSSIEDVALHLPGALENDAHLSLFRSLAATPCHSLSKVVISSLIEVDFSTEPPNDRLTMLTSVLGPLRSIKTLIDVSILLRHHQLRLSTQALIDLLTSWPLLQYV